MEGTVMVSASILALVVCHGSRRNNHALLSEDGSPLGIVIVLERHVPVLMKEYWDGGG